MGTQFFNSSDKLTRTAMKNERKALNARPAKYSNRDLAAAQALATAQRKKKV